MPSFNITAFQKFAFQTCAFQQEVATEYWAFQYEVFQWDSFQVEECQEETVVEYKAGTGGGTNSHASRKNLLELHRLTKERNEERLRLDAERLADAERETDKVLARIARANEPEPSEPVVIPIPETIDPEQVTQVEPLAPVNDLVATFAEPLTTLAQSVTTLSASRVAELETLRQRDEDEALALIMILAEID